MISDDKSVGTRKQLFHQIDRKPSHAFYCINMTISVRIRTESIIPVVVDNNCNDKGEGTHSHASIANKIISIRTGCQ